MGACSRFRSWRNPGARSTVAEILNGLPDAARSIARGREQFARGGGIPLDEL
jgi:hypothetical protein